MIDYNSSEVADVKAIEDIVKLSLSNSVSTQQKGNITQIIESLKKSAERWRIGLSLFIESADYGVKYFGLNLIRDYLSNYSLYSILVTDPSATNSVTMDESAMKTSLLQHQYEVKTAMMNWIQQHLILMNTTTIVVTDIPSYIINNIASILSLLIKSTYPEYWPSAFTDMLNIGKQNAYTLNLVLQFLSEITIDIVEFDDKRTKTEVNHNTLVKDTMRSTSAVMDIIEFLYTYVSHLYQQYKQNIHIHNQNVTIIEKCLICFGKYIGWIDISIVAKDSIISMLNVLLLEKMLVNSVCICYIEMIKKGMESSIKVKLINSIQLIQTLTDLLNQRIEASRVAALNKNTYSSSTEELFDDVYDEEYATLTDLLFQTLINIWSEHEQVKLTPLNSARSITSSTGSNTPVKNAQMNYNPSLLWHQQPTPPITPAAAVAALGSNNTFNGTTNNNNNNSNTTSSPTNKATTLLGKGPFKSSGGLSLNISSALSLNLPNFSNTFSAVGTTVINGSINSSHHNNASDIITEPPISPRDEAFDKEMAELSTIAEVLARNLKDMMKILLFLFQQKSFKMYSIVIPSVNKVILHYKYQLNKNRDIHNLILQESNSKKNSLKYQGQPPPSQLQPLPEYYSSKSNKSDAGQCAANVNYQYDYYESEVYINDIFLIIYKQLQVTEEESFLLNKMSNHDDINNNSSSNTNVGMMSIYNNYFSNGPGIAADGDDGVIEDYDEDVKEMIEVKKEVKKLFVNLCRFVPETCLDFIAHSLAQLGEPLSAAPFSQLEASLKLIKAFSDCGGVKIDKLMSSGQRFPALISALFQTDIAQHPHIQVLMCYFDICGRYVRFISVETVQLIVIQLLNTTGIKHNKECVRSKAASVLVKIMESLDSKAALFLSTVGDVSPELFHVELGVKSYLSNQAQTQYMEAISLVLGQCSAVNSCSNNNHNNNSLSSTTINAVPLVSITTIQVQQANHILFNLANLLIQDNMQLLNHPLMGRYHSDIANLVGHKISCLTSLSRGYSNYYKTNSSVMSVNNNNNSIVDPEQQQYQFHVIFQRISEMILVLSYDLSSNLTVRCKIAIFFNRMVNCLGPTCLPNIHKALLSLTMHLCEDSLEPVIQLVNLILLEFNSSVQGIIDVHLGMILNKLETFNMDKYANMNGSNGSSSSKNIEINAHNITTIKTVTSTAVAATTNLIASMKSEIVNIEKMYLNFISHIVTNNCIQTFTCETNIKYIETVLYHLLISLKGLYYNGHIRVAQNQLNMSSLQQQQQNGQDYMIELEDSLPQRKTAVSILIAFITFCMMPDNNNSSNSSSTNTGNLSSLSTITSSSSLSSSHYLKEFQVYFANYIHELILPIILQSCISHKLCCNFSIYNGATYSYYNEVAIFLYTLHNSYSSINSNGNHPELFVQICQLSVAIEFGWSDSILEQFRQFLLCSVDQSPSKIKDTFKRLLMSLNNSNMSI